MFSSYGGGREADSKQERKEYRTEDKIVSKSMDLLDDYRSMDILDGYRSISLCEAASSGSIDQREVSTHYDFWEATDDSRLHLSSSSSKQENLVNKKLDGNRLAVDVVTSTPLKILPKFVSKHTSFVAELLSPNPIFDRIVTALTELAENVVDLSINESKFKLKGFISRDCFSACFSVKFFRNAANEVVVVFTRTEGCVVLFNMLYRHVLETLAEDKMVARTLNNNPIQNKKAAMGSSKSPLCPVFSLALLPQNSVDDGECRSHQTYAELLLATVQTQQIDQQREACSALLSLAQSGKCDLLKMPSFLSITSTLLISEDSEIMRLSALILASALENGKIGISPEDAATLQSMFDVLGVPGSYRNQAAKAALVQGIYYLARSGSSSDLFSDVNILLLKRFQNSACKSIRENVTDTLRMFECK